MKKMIFIWALSVSELTLNAQLSRHGLVLYYFKQLPSTYGMEKSPDRKNKFDVPVVAKITYSLKVVEFEVSGKYGLVNVMESPNQTTGKYRELQVSLFIPF